MRQRDGTIKFQNDLEDAGDERQRIEDMWQFEKTFSSPHETGGFHSTAGGDHPGPMGISI